jgi:transcriptional regulator with XRE-family HTH domain
MKADITRKEVANRIKEIRLSKGLTQTDVAKRGEINVGYYARVERGEIEPSVGTLERIATGLDVRSSEILPF